MLLSSAQIEGVLGSFETFKRRNLPAGASRLARSFAARRGLLISPRGGVVVAASALTAAAWHEFEHRRVVRADLEPSQTRICSLADIEFNRASLDLIERELVHEWGPFAFVGFESLAEMST